MDRARSALPVTRRQTLLGLLATSMVAVPGPLPADTRRILDRYSRAEISSVALRDLHNGGMLEQSAPDLALPPASVLKIMSSLYALEALGPGYRFSTSLRTTGPIVDGRLRGQLALVGGGDPTLDVNALETLADRLAETGLRGIDGDFLVVNGALPSIAEIDPAQPAHVGYNPAISGLNLNFNRVRVEWAPGKSGPDFGFFAPGRDFRVAVAGVGGELGSAPPPQHRMEGPRELWTLPGPKMQGHGGLWLPVRNPAAHAGEVFRDLAARKDMTLPEPKLVTDAPDGTDLTSHDSAPLREILRDMLRYSTNLTAEVIGLRASQARGTAPESLAASGAAMTEWARARFGLSEARFVDHSGLSDLSRWSASETVQVLAAAADGPLPDLLREQNLSDASAPVPGHVHAVAKTGTLYFASGLAGYLESPDRRMAFAIYTADLSRRAAIDQPAPSAPPGSRAWSSGARALQRELLRDWGAQYLPKPHLRPLRRPG